METIDRYLSAVRSMLPKAEREDILAELSEEIRSQVESREEELGRPLTPEEQEAILQPYGHPMVVAGRYQKPEGTLAFGGEIIGPELFPFYLKALKVLLVLSVLSTLIALTARNSTAPIGLGEILLTFLTDLGIKLGIATLVFAVLQRGARRHPERWEGSTAAKPKGESRGYVRFEAAVE
ncbi:hypothetical protein EON81_27595, partial [bacterium]